MDSDDEAAADLSALASIEDGGTAERGSSSIVYRTLDGAGSLSRVSSTVYRSLDAIGMNVVPLEPHQQQSAPALDVAFLTWNINGKDLTHEDATAWVGCVQGRADVYFVAIQELIDIEAKSGRPDRAIREKNSAEAAEKAAEVLQAVLSDHAGEELVPLGASAMLAIFLVGFARPSLATAPLHAPLCLPAHYTEEAAAAFEAAGRVEEATTFREKVGQKGGVAVGVRLGGASVCVMCVHLPAGDKDKSCEERDKAAYGLRSALPDLEPPPLLVMVGDVNSRTNLCPQVTKDLLLEGSVAQVLEYDELVSGQATWAADLCEAEVDWNPSYKFTKAAEFDEKKAPSYCDRVLWGSNAQVLPREYSIAPGVNTSDHKPVAALLNIAQ